MRWQRHYEFRKMETDDRDCSPNDTFVSRKILLVESCWLLCGRHFVTASGTRLFDRYCVFKICFNCCRDFQFFLTVNLEDIFAHEKIYAISFDKWTNFRHPQFSHFHQLRSDNSIHSVLTGIPSQEKGVDVCLSCNNLILNKSILGALSSSKIRYPLILV